MFSLTFTHNSSTPNLKSNLSFSSLQPILLWFKLIAHKGKRKSLLLFSRKDSSEQMHVDFYSRKRTLSIPSMRKPHLSLKARRISSHRCVTNPVFHNQEWYEKTQELFRSMRSCQKVSDQSSRFTSHHSSSSEEWYADLSSVDNLAMSKDTRMPLQECNDSVITNTKLTDIESITGNERASHLDDQITNQSLPGSIASSDRVEIGSVRLEIASPAYKKKSSGRSKYKFCGHKACPCHCTIS